MPSRSSAFEADREPLHHEKALQLVHDEVFGAIKSFYPTQARFAYFHGNNSTNLSYYWTARNQRKGRHAIISSPATTAHAVTIATPPSTSDLCQVRRGVVRMLTGCLGSISVVSAVCFTLGGVAYLVNGALTLSLLGSKDCDYGGPRLATIIGGLFFMTGSIGLVNETDFRDGPGCFGWSVVNDSRTTTGVERLAMQDASTAKAIPNCSGVMCKHERVKEARCNSCGTAPSPIHYNLSSYHLIGSWGLAIGSFLYFVTALMAIGSGISSTDGAIWIKAHASQLRSEDTTMRSIRTVGATLYILSTIFLVLETQHRWWKPALQSLGWHVGAWGLLGGVLFLFSHTVGFASQPWAHPDSPYGSWACRAEAWSFTFGSIGFLISGLLQWYEATNGFVVIKSRA